MARATRNERREARGIAEALKADRLAAKKAEDFRALDYAKRTAAESSSTGGWLTFLVIGGITVALLADW